MRRAQIQSAIFLLPVLFFVSCNLPGSTGINLKNDDEISVFDVFSGIEVIPLETNMESQFSDISRVLYHQERYYIFDRTSNALFCFGQEGDFLFKIHSQGNGKGEYHYVADVNIDRKNNLIVLLDPILQKIFFYDLSGNYLKTIALVSNENLGLKQVYVLDDKVLMFAGRHHAFLYYSLKDEKFFRTEYSIHSLSGLFSSRHHVYQMNGRTYGLPPLSNQVMELSGKTSSPWFKFDLGKYNHHQKQIDEVIKQEEERSMNGNNVLSFRQIVGPGKPLHHGIVMVNETSRFRLALIEFDNALKNIIIDKKVHKTFVFTSFTEGTILPWANIQEDRAIAYFQGPMSRRDSLAIVSVGLGDEVFNRNRTMYTPEMVSESDRMIIDQHNLLHDNPFLVIFNFKK